MSAADPANIAEPAAVADPVNAADPVSRAGVVSASTAAPTWWRRPGLDVADGRLVLNDVDLEALARQHGTPLFVYDLARPRENMRALQAALMRAGVPYLTRFALKACPDPRILAVLRAMGAPGTPGSVGIDACSPGEVIHALANGWEPFEISHTGTNVSERDLDVLLAHPIRINLDGVSQVERLGRRSPGRTIGLRVNQGAGAGYTEHLAYAGERPTKFGITEDRLDDAIAAVRRHGLVVDTLHFHAGSGWLGDQLDGFETALERATPFLDRLLAEGFPIREVNVAAAWGAWHGTGSGRWTSTPTRRSWRATWSPTGSRPPSSPGTSSSRTRVCSSARWSASSAGAPRPSWASTSAGTSTAPTSSTGTRRRSSPSATRSANARSW